MFRPLAGFPAFQCGPASAVLLFALSLLGTDAAAHGGGLNAEGCHYDRRMGEYHCHRAKAARAPAPNGLAAKDTAATPPLPPRTVRKARRPMTMHQSARLSDPTCYTGPRGGTYTITRSGNKNYGGC